MGLFVAFEGGEGAGKSTQVARLASWLGAAGQECVATREPGATLLGQRIRGLLLAEGPPPVARAEALLFAADRAQHVEAVLRPALDRGAIVVSDRYTDSSLAYQGAGRGMPAEDLAAMVRLATAGLRPDLVVLLDVEPALGLRRAAKRGRADRLEREPAEFHRRVRQEFLRLAAAEPARYLVLDASEDAESLAAAVQKRVAPLLCGERRPEGAASP